ncbi:MAG: hypothetical protein EXQ48_07300 [Acidobacteria bacterium]|nr:hypothetical protein [Acidobacteriota bacterium]
MNDAELREKIGRVTPSTTSFSLRTAWQLLEGALSPLAAPRARGPQGDGSPGKRALDVCCRDGLLSFEAERLASSEVIGIDNDLSLAAVEFLIAFFNSRVRISLARHFQGPRPFSRTFHRLRQRVTRTSPKTIDRGVFVCGLSPKSIDRTYGDYWDGTHDFHSGRRY